MNARDLLDLLRARPFVPFRLYATDGRTYEIRHPDQALVLRSRVVLPRDTTNGIPESSEHLALLHIIRAEELAAESGPGGNGVAPH
jgi:hypothetical protein